MGSYRLRSSASERSCAFVLILAISFLSFLLLQIVLILVCTQGSSESKALFPQGKKDVYLLTVASGARLGIGAADHWRRGVAST